MGLRTKTWSREVSVALMIGLGALAYNDKTDLVEILVWPVTTFSLAAFGFQQPVVSEWMRGRSSQSANGGRS